MQYFISGHQEKSQSILNWEKTQFEETEKIAEAESGMARMLEL